MSMKTLRSRSLVSSHLTWSEYAIGSLLNDAARVSGSFLRSQSLAASAAVARRRRRSLIVRGLDRGVGGYGARRAPREQHRVVVRPQDPGDLAAAQNRDVLTREPLPGRDDSCREDAAP